MRTGTQTQINKGNLDISSRLGTVRLASSPVEQLQGSSFLAGPLPGRVSSEHLFPRGVGHSSVRARPTMAKNTGSGVQSLRETLGSVRQVCTAELEASPSGPALYTRYLNLFTAQADALAVGIEAQNMATASSGAQSVAYANIVSEAREALRTLGKVFGVQTPIFSKAVHGEHTWPTRTEVGPSGRRYVNSFKSSDLLSTADKEAYFAKKLAKFEGRGGKLSEDILIPRDQSNFENQVRYDYCLLENGTLRSASRAEGSADPGHLLLAEGSETFKDTRVAMAGELMIVRDDQEQIVAALVACNSGHFKPFAEDLPRMLPALKALGVSPEKVVFIGGPNNGSALLPEIADKFEITTTRKAPDLEVRRAKIREKIDGPKQLKPWQRP